MSDNRVIDEAINGCLTQEELKPYLKAVEIDGNLEYFHLHDRAGNVTGVFDSNVVNYLIQAEHIFFLNETPYIYENGVYKRDNDGSILMTMISRLIYPKYQRIGTIKRIYGLFVSNRWLKKSIDELNKYPDEWVIFNNCIYDAKNKEIMPHTSTIYAINQIPFDFNPDKPCDSSKIDSWLDETLSPQEKEMFLEYAGYCMTKDTRQQKFLMFTGEGGTGKSLFINLVGHVLGNDNISSMDLKSLAENRFASFNLFQKLLNECADIDKSSLSDVANIKLLTGGDIIKGEAKGKEPIFFRNYAKLLFSANEIPRIKGESTSAFYRRLLVIPLNKKPEHINTNMLSELDSQIDGFISLCMQALNNLYNRGEIYESSTSKKATQNLRLYSDSIEAFLLEKTIKCKDGKIYAKDLHEAYKDYCIENELQPVLKQNFFRACDAKGFSHADGRNIKGLIWKPKDFENAVSSDEIPFS